MIKQKLNDFDINIESIIGFTADGAGVNKKVARLLEIPVQLCMNHGIHLGNVYFFFHLNLPKIFFEAVLDVLYSKKSEIQPNENDFDEEYSTPLQNALTMSNPELKDSEFKCSIKALRKVVKKFKKSALLTNFLEKETGKKLHLGKVHESSVKLTDVKS